MKAIHKAGNWKKMELNDGDVVMVYRYAPTGKNGDAYPSEISWSAICAAYVGAGTSNMDCHVPQVWLREDPRVMGVVWEICSRWELGEYDEGNTAYSAQRYQWIKSLVCAVHQHLGSAYADFVTMK